MIRLAWALTMFALAQLAVLRAPEYHLWMLAILVTEWGHAFAALSLLSLAPGWTLTRAGKISAGLGLASCLIFLTPLVRSRPVAAELPGRLDAVFGPAAVADAPLSYAAVFLGVPRPRALITTETYAMSCGEPLRLELYRPLEKSAPAPLVLVVHGGSWQSGTRLELDALSRRLAERGYAVASVDYGLAPRTVFPGPVEDLRDALAYLRRRAGELGIDASRVVLLGRSAGGQIALAAAHDAEPFPGLKGVVNFYGPNDMFLAWRVPGPKRMIDSRKLLLQYLGGSPADKPDLYARASPLLRAGKASPPILMIHGGRDEMVWPVHEYRLSEKLAAAGVKHYFLDMPWATHGCDYNFSGPCGQLSTYAVERFLSFAFK